MAWDREEDGSAEVKLYSMFGSINGITDLISIFDAKDANRLGEDLDRFFITLSDEERLACAKKFLQLFIQNNWTGPVNASMQGDCKLFAHASMAGGSSVLNMGSVRDSILTALVVDGEWPYRLIRDPIFLLLAKCLYLSIFERDGSLPSTRLEKEVDPNLPSDVEFGDSWWWYLRCLFMHQRILDNPVATLKERIYSIGKDAIQTFKNTPSQSIELAIIYQYYHDEAASLQCISKACETEQFKCFLGGALGKRTKFQQANAVQLVVLHTAERGVDRMVTVDCCNGEVAASKCTQPINLPLSDDVLLECTEFAPRPDQSADLINNEPPLSLIALSILLANATHLLRFNAIEETVVEKAMAYIAKVLEKPNDWSIYSTALYLRSHLEAGKSRMIERAALQIQALVDQIGVEGDELSLTSPASARQEFFFSVSMPSPWEMDREQGFLFARLGVFRTALAIFNKRQLWDECISCLIQLEEKEKAEQLIREQLEQQPDNPRLWCILGDLLEEPSYFEKAWLISGSRYARAQRAMGNYYFVRQKWEQAIASFEHSLLLNGLYEKTWFLLGCAAMQIADKEKALKAFTRVVYLNKDNSDGWNNLAAAHLQFGPGHEEEARCALREACRLDFENWKVWDNLAQVCFDIGEWQESINAYKRVVKIREKQTSLDLFKRYLLVAEMENKQNPCNAALSKMMNELDELINLTLIEYFSISLEFWYLVSMFYRIKGDRRQRFEALLKAYRACSGTSYENDPISAERVVNCVMELWDAVTEESAVVPASDSKSIFTDQEKYQVECIAKLVGRKLEGKQQFVQLERIINRV